MTLISLGLIATDQVDWAWAGVGWGKLEMLALGMLQVHSCEWTLSSL